MKLIDLHVHSTASDGSFTPAEVTALAREAGLTAIALTDHDTVSGVGEALAAAGDFPLEVVPGVELSCLYKEKEIHILGLYIDHTDKAPFSVVVLGKFRRFLLVIFLSLFLHLDFSFIYSKFSMPFWGFFY